MAQRAQVAQEERDKLEAAEAGRRQRLKLVAPSESHSRVFTRQNSSSGSVHAESKNLSSSSLTEERAEIEPVEE